MNGALCKVSSGRDMPKLSPASWRLTAAILKVSWRFLENMESSSLNILLRIGQVTSSNGSFKRRTQMTWITLHEWLLMHILMVSHTVIKDAAAWGSVCPKVLCQQAPAKPRYGKPAAFPASGRLACRPLGLQSNSTKTCPWWVSQPKSAAGCSGRNIRQHHFVLPMKMPMGRFSQFFRHVKTPKQKPIKAACKSTGHANFWHSLNGDKGVSKPKDTVVIDASTQNDESMPGALSGETASAAAGAETKRTASQGSSPEKKRAIRTWQLWNQFSRI